MEFLKAFAKHNEYSAFTGTSEFVKPNVSLCQQENEVHYNPLWIPDANGHTYVDLGLPSGTLWATMNVGANSENELGCYFCWAETLGSCGNTSKNSTWRTYEYANKAYNKLTKYCTDTTYGNDGFVDNLTTLELMDDAANVNWGGDWHIPSDEQFQELINNTYQSWNSSNSAMTVTSIHNGNSLLFKSGGYASGSYGDKYDRGEGYYWLNSLGGPTELDLNDVGPNYAHYFKFGNNAKYIYNYERCLGMLVRGVLG